MTTRTPLIADDPPKAELTVSPRHGWRVDPVLVVVAALAFSAAVPVAPGATLAALLISLALLAPRLPARAILVALCAVGLGSARSAFQLSSFDRAYVSTRDFLGAPSRCGLVGRIVSSPVERGGSLRFDAELDSLDCEGRERAGPIRARLYGTEAALARGDVFVAVADLGSLSLFQNFDLPDPKPAAARGGVVVSGALLSIEVTERGHSITSLIDRARAHVRSRIEATFSSQVMGMARALVLGENDLDESDAEAFKKSGLSHLLAVSGTHLIFAVLSIVRGLRALLLRWQSLASRTDVARHAALVGLLLAPLYADFAGGSGSAWRAAWMLIAVLGVRLLGRHVFPSRIIAASLGLGWLSDGLVVFDPSFLLSLGATVGLVCMGGELDERALKRAVELTEPRAPNLAKLWQSCSRAALTTLAASLPCVPILLVIAPGITLASVAANLVAGPLGEVIALPLCLVHTLLAPVPALEVGVALVASGALALIRGLAHASASVEFLYFELPPPGAEHFIVLAASAAALVSLRSRRWFDASRKRASINVALSRAWVALSALALILAELAARRAGGAHAGRLRVSALDVGQGDSTLIDLPDGRLMLIDAGGFVGSPIDPGELVVLPTLRARRRSRVDIMVLTHPHPDHYGGLSSVADRVEVGEFWYAGQAPDSTRPEHAPTGQLARLFERLRQKGVRLRPARELCKEALGDARYHIRVLAPCPDVASEQSANDNSLVIRIESPARAAHLRGDAEHWPQQR